MFGLDGVTEEQITITMDGECAIVEGPPPCDPLKASGPDPRDGAKGVSGSLVSGVTLCWRQACCLGTLGRQYFYFGTDEDDVIEAPPYRLAWVPPDEFIDPPLFANVGCKNVGPLPIWTTHYWRVDSKCETGEMTKGDVWSFTTGCDPVPTGDVNLDCLVNLDDWALILTTWGEEQFFPWD
jgi:hypothetical protein